MAIILDIAMIIIIARVILSWVSPDPHNPIVRLINQLSEPILFPVRRRVPYFQGMDFSALIVLMLIYFVDTAIVQTLHRFALMLSAH
ncbi:MAG: YggT family protein [Mariprofundaceae bacterium]|nr:YggT family protein [Mariprofundaceae bacterium]